MPARAVNAPSERVARSVTGAAMAPEAATAAVKIDVKETILVVVVWKLFVEWKVVLESE